MKSIMNRNSNVAAVGYSTAALSILLILATAPHLLFAGTTAWAYTGASAVTGFYLASLFLIFHLTRNQSSLVLCGAYFITMPARLVLGLGIALGFRMSTDMDTFLFGALLCVGLVQVLTLEIYYLCTRKLSNESGRSPR